MEWIDEKGKLIEILPFFTVLYTNEETRKLNQVYDIETYSGRAFLKECNDTSKLMLLEDILKVSQMVGSIIGISQRELFKFREALKENYQELVQSGYLNFVEEELLFPTEKLIKELEYLSAIRKK